MRNSRLISCLFVAASLTASARAASNSLLGWNDLGMHCMDADYGVFSILPPYNTIHAQFISEGKRLSVSNVVAVTYEAVPDATGSINKSSVGKSDFWSVANGLYLPPGAPDLAPDAGLAGFAMPGPNNTPQPMRFGEDTHWFTAEGIPITPRDDTGRQNAYPMMRLVARNAGGAALATADIVLPVSAEMNCRACHASGTRAEPPSGWEWDCDPDRDYRWNILNIHDGFNNGSAKYLQALKTAGYATTGLYDTAKQFGPILCARCHASNALPGSGQPGIPPLTQAIHSWHAEVSDPESGKLLKDDTTRAACYRCHPGSETRCLRGAMGSAVAADGSRAMDCQSCHGNMEKVGAASRRGWLDEPNCQNCHTGTAVKNRGSIRFTSAFDNTGNLRTAADPTFATNPNVPVAGASLFRFSRGHGGLYCEACHGSTHAEFPSTEPNDNVYSQNLQGHAGMIAECTACHTSQPATWSGGPHGLHPIGESWINGHKDPGENPAACQACHGADLRGTVLSRTLAKRTLNAFGTKNWWRGFQVGCYSCHAGPDSEDGNPNHPAVVTSASLSTTAGKPAALELGASDADGDTLALRIVAQPQHGTVALAGRTATFHPEPGFVGKDSFTFAAWDGSTDSNLGTVSLAVTEGDCALTLSATVPTELQVGVAAPFRAVAKLDGCDLPVEYLWTWPDFTSAGPGVCRGFATPGTFNWQVKASAGAASQTLSGVVTVKFGPVVEVPLTIARSGAGVKIAWPQANVGYQLESALNMVAPTWQPIGPQPTIADGQFTVAVPTTQTAQYFRLHKRP